jgi:DNA-binding response OmpR family regulator
MFHPAKALGIALSLRIIEKIDNRDDVPMTFIDPQRSVLIVEDEPSFREALVMAIGDEGYDVHSASNGAEAIDLLEHVTPDIIILDIHMPIMDGPAFLTEYRSRHEHCAPVIICSTRRHDATISRLDVSAFLNKPVDIDELLDAIQDNITLSS